MSAWGIGASAMTRRGIGVRRAGSDPATVEPPIPSVDTLVTWIPGEVVAFYTALVLAMQPGAPSSGGQPPLEVTWGGWLVGGFVLACSLTWLGGWSKVKKLDLGPKKELTLRTFLAGLAFLLWSFVVPGSWWYSIELIAENQAAMPILVGVVAVAFGLLAEGSVRRIE